MNFVVAVLLMAALGCTASGGELDSHLIRRVSDFRSRNGEEDVFNVMCSLLDGHRYRLRSLWADGFPGLVLRTYQFEQALVVNLPKLRAHMAAIEMSTAAFASQWFLTLFAHTLPMRLLLRVWELFFVAGWSALIAVSVAILATHEEQLLRGDFEVFFRLVGREVRPWMLSRRSLPTVSRAQALQVCCLLYCLLSTLLSTVYSLPAQTLQVCRLSPHPPLYALRSRITSPPPVAARILRRSRCSGERNGRVGGALRRAGRNARGGAPQRRRSDRGALAGNHGQARSRVPSPPPPHLAERCRDERRRADPCRSSDDGGKKAVNHGGLRPRAASPRHAGERACDAARARAPREPVVARGREHHYGGDDGARHGAFAAAEGTPPSHCVPSVAFVEVEQTAEAVDRDDDGEFSLFTVTFYANLAHSFTRSPSHL